MKQKLLSSFRLRVVMLVAILCSTFTGTVWGQETWSHSFESGQLSTGAGNKTLSNISWTQSSCTYIGWDSNNGRGIQIGSGSNATKSFSLSTTAFNNYTISNITVNSSMASSGTAKLSVKVGDTSYLTNQTLTTSATDYSCSPLASGTVVISWTNTSKAFYVKSISITYTNAGSSAVATTTTINLDGITNTDVYTSTTAGSLSATVTAGGNAVSGASVTWSGNNDAVATINSNTGAVTLVGAGSVTFTATYAGSDEYQASSATYEMNVTNNVPYVQPTTIEITPNYTFWGKTAQFSGTDYSELSGSKDNVTLDWTRGDGSTYANTTAMRFYKDNTLTFTAPTGYEIISIELTVTGASSDLSFSPAGYDNTTTTWTGSSETVTMSRPSNASSYATISKFTITIALPSSEPSITIDPAIADHAASDEEGTLAISYKNLTISNMTDFAVQFCDSEGNGLASAPEWITVDVAEQDPNVGEGYVVSYIMEANTGEARTAYFKIFALGDQDYVYSNLVTVTQATYVAPFVPSTWTLANSITSGKHYIIVNSDVTKAMGGQNTNNRYAVDVEIENDVVTVNSSDVVEFKIYGPDAEGLYTIYDGNGYLYAASSGSNHLKTQEKNNNNGRWEITFGEDNIASIVATKSNNRNTMQYNGDNNNNLFSCYGSASQTAIKLFEKVGEVTPTEKKTLNAYGYATYCSQNALDFSNNSNVTAWAISSANSSTGVITFSQLKGKVAAGTGMLLKGDASTEVTLTSATGKDDVSGNLLIGTTADFVVENNGAYYGLSGKEFVPVNAGTVKAGKALLPASAVGSAARLSFVFEDDNTTTGISEELRVKSEESFYNLNGQRVSDMKKGGLYIMNGKKVIVK